MSKITREAYIEKRVAEGFTVEQANNEYDGYLDPSIKEATEQKVPTRADMIVMINEAINNNPNRKKVYIPDFKLSKEYLAVKAELEALKGVSPYDAKKAEDLSKRMLSIQITGTVTDEVRQAEIDKTLEMPIKQVIVKRKEYEQIVAECEEKIDNFDFTAVQAKADGIEAEYQKKLKGKNGIAFSTIKAEYEAKVDELEYEEVIKPLNDLKLQRYEAKEYYLIYEARVKYYVNANRTLIEEEMLNAKRMEVRGSLADLAEYLEEA